MINSQRDNQFYYQRHTQCVSQCDYLFHNYLQFNYFLL